MKTLFIINPASRGGRNASLNRKTLNWIEKNLPEGKVQFTEGPGHASELAQSAGKDGVQGLVSVGGDGTFSEMVAGVLSLPRASRPKVFPMSRGTGGDFPRRLAELYPIPKSLDWLKNPHSTPLDGGKMRCLELNGKLRNKFFINIADVGLAGEVTRQVNSGSKALGALTYIKSTLWASFRYHSTRVRLEGFEGEGTEKLPKEMELMLLIMANGPYFGGGLCIAPDARWDDGQFQVIAAPKVSYWTLLGQLPRLYLKKRMSHPRVQYASGTGGKVISMGSPLPVDADGEFFEAYEVDFSILPNALELMIPAPRAG